MFLPTSEIEVFVIGLSRTSYDTKKSSSITAPSMLLSWASTRAPTTPSAALRTTRLWRCHAQLVAPLFQHKNTTKPMFPSAVRGSLLQQRVSRNSRPCLAMKKPVTSCLETPSPCVNTSRRFTLGSVSSAHTLVVSGRSRSGMISTGMSG